MAISTNISLKSLAFVDDGAFLPGSMADLMEVVRGLMWYEEHFLVKIHRKKSQLLNIGECARLDDSVWVEEAQSVKVLGALFERTVNVENLWEERVQNIEGLLVAHQRTHFVSIFERVVYVNTYALPLLFYLAPAFNLEEKYAKKVERSIWRFVWRGKL